MTHINTTSSEVPPFTIKAASFFLLAGLLVYPFTIAGSNLFFALLLIFSFYQISILYRGWEICWHEYKPLTIATLLFIGITFIGTLWSEYNALAFHKMGKQINWLFIPIIIGLVAMHPNLRFKAFIALSVGMFLHLILCTFQFFNLVHIKGLGSGVGDATGFVGHLSFGFIYGIWAGLLLVVAQKLPSKWKYLCYIASAYAVTMVFLAQGRSGYITTFACLILVIFKVYFPNRLKAKLMILASLIVLLSIFASQHTPTRQKIERTISGVSAFMQGDWKHVDERIKIWNIAFHIWKEHPYLGVGTAGYPDAAKELISKPEMAYLGLPKNSLGVYHGHPHSEFLFALSRWGPIGLLILIYLCWQWVKTGWHKDWKHDTINAYLMTASGISVILHGMTEPSLNTQIETVFAIIALGFSMSKGASEH